MIAITLFPGKKVAVFGLGLSGLATAKALAAGGAEPVVWDDGEKGREAARAEGFAPVDLTAADWSEFAALVLAPGVPLTHPKPHWTVERARAAGVEIIGDTELFCRQRRAEGSRAKVVAITGTNGKSTTTALTTHLIAASGRRAVMGGNIGTAVLALDPLADDITYVLEYSSFQIDLTPSLDADAACLLNITPDHLDRHGTLEHYAAVKARMFDRLGPDQTAVIGVDDEICAGIADRLEGRTRGSAHFGAARGRGRRLCRRAGAVRRRGRQGRPAGQPCGHRLAARRAQRPERRRRLRPVPRYRPHRARKSPRALPPSPASPTAWRKSAGSGPCCSSTIPRPPTPMPPPRRCRASMRSTGSRAASPRPAGSPGSKPISQRSAAPISSATPPPISPALSATRCRTRSAARSMPRSSAAARDAAASGDKEPVVLLSPACASYDQFPNFVVRGDAFRAIVASLGGRPDAGDGSGMRLARTDRSVDCRMVVFRRSCRCWARSC